MVVALPNGIEVLCVERLVRGAEKPVPDANALEVHVLILRLVLRLLEPLQVLVGQGDDVGAAVRLPEGEDLGVLGGLALGQVGEEEHELGDGREEGVAHVLVRPGEPVVRV